MTLFTHHFFLIVVILAFTVTVYAQQSNESAPKEVRGYKVHRAEVELKKTKDSDKKKKPNKDDYDETEPILIRLGDAQLVNTSPLGVTFDVPVVIAAVKQQGEVDRLVFEDMKVNETAVTLEDYVHQFALPNKEPLSLNPPLRIFVSMPQAVLRTIDEIFNSKEVWQVTGRIYVLGHFKKYLFKFKRAVPVDVQTSINNPLR